MKVLITGSTGYLGHQLALNLAKQNIICHALVRDINSKSIPKHKNVLLFKGDLCDKASIDRAIKGCVYVFHVAAFTDLCCTNIENFYSVNVQGTTNLLDSAYNEGVKKFIHTSTLSVYGPSLKSLPIEETQPRISSYKNDYELTKSMSEEEVLKYDRRGLPAMILNVSRIYGPGLCTFSNGVNKLIRKISNKKILFVPAKMDITANYVYIDDVVNAHINAMNSEVSGEKFIIGGDNISYDGLFRRIKFLTRSKVSFIRLNYSLTKVVLLGYETLNRIIGLKPQLTPNVLDSLFTNRVSSSNKAKEILHYKTTSLNIGLLKTVEYLKS